MFLLFSSVLATTENIGPRTPYHHFKLQLFVHALTQLHSFYYLLNTTSDFMLGSLSSIIF